MDPVAKTSLLTAAMRAAESSRSDAEGRLFSDPYAGLLAGPEGASLLQRALAESGEQPAIALRTRYMDEKILAAVKDGIRQFVILASGMDTRAYRLSFPEDARIFELDRKEVLDHKQGVLGSERLPCLRYALAVDLREDWQSQLTRGGFHSGERALWLVEGLLMYLDEEQVSTLMSRINASAAPNDVLLFDVLGRTLLDSPHMRKQLRFLESIGAPWKFGVDEPEEFMKKFGWQASATQPGEFMPSRWPFPTAPRGVPNVPRSFFVEAHKL